MRHLTIERVNGVISGQGLHFLDAGLWGTTLGARFGALEHICHLRVSEAGER